MTVHRRAVLGAATLAPMLATAARGQPAPASAASATAPTPEQRIAPMIAANRRPLTLAGGAFSGPGWDLLRGEAADAQFTLLGEEHGTAEIALLAGQLFEALQPAGYRHVALEVSPFSAGLLDAAARGGVDGLKRLFATPRDLIAFYTLRQEAEFLARIRRAAPGPEPLLWGLDYEVGADRPLIAELARRAPPSAAPPSPGWTRRPRRAGPPSARRRRRRCRSASPVTPSWSPPSAAPGRTWIPRARCCCKSRRRRCASTLTSGRRNTTSPTTGAPSSTAPTWSATGAPRRPPAARPR